MKLKIVFYNKNASSLPKLFAPFVACFSHACPKNTSFFRELSEQASE
jgi:hypothetical protein